MPGLPTKPNNIPLSSSLPKVSFRRIPPQDALQLSTPAGVLDHLNVAFGFNDGSHFEKPEHYLRHVEPIESDLKKQVEYDMDEQDQEWLDALNRQRRKEQLDPVSYETFEIIVDQLEKEWFDLMKRVPPKHHHHHPYPLNQDDASDDGEDAKCAICDDGECENSNAIVFCDGCNLAVHQDCYGIPYIPEGQWLCRKCTVSPDRAVSCILCPHEGGAFKQTTTGKWAHLLCAMWIPETGVSNHVYMEPIESIERIPKARWKLQCYLCRCKVGACIQCDNKTCFTAFHATCGRKAGLLIKTERRRQSTHAAPRNTHTYGQSLHDDDDDDDDQDDDDAVEVLRACCHKHIPRNMRDQLKIPFNRVAALTADYDSEASMRASPFHTPRTREQSFDHPNGGGAPPLIPVSRSGSLQAPINSSSKSARAYKKSYKPGPPLVPQYIVDRVLEYIAKISLRKKQMLVVQVSRFWSLKREARRGAPLLKRLHLEPWTASSQNKEQNDANKVKKLNFLQTLRYDLEKVRLLAELVRKREKEKLHQIQLIRSALVDAIIFPYHELLSAALAKFESFDRPGYFAAPVSRADVPDYYDIIKEPMDWGTIKQKLAERNYTSVDEFKEDVGRIVKNATVYNKPETPFHRAALRIQKQMPAIFQQLESIEHGHLAEFQNSLERQNRRIESLDEEVARTVRALQLEPPLDLLTLLRDYDDMPAEDLLSLRGRESGPTSASASADSTPQDRLQPARQTTPVHNAIQDLCRQFYVPDPVRVPKSRAKASKRRRDSSEIRALGSRAERRVSRRLKRTDQADAEALVELQDKPRKTSRAGTRRLSTLSAASSASTETASTALGGATNGYAEPSVPTIHEESGEGEGEMNGQVDAVNGARRSSKRKREATAVAASDGASPESSAKKQKLKRGQIPDEPKTLEVKEVGDWDSFKRFNTGWVLPEGTKRGGRAQAPPPSTPTLAKRPRKVSEPSRSTPATENGHVSASKKDDPTSSPRRPRSQTQPSKSAQDVHGHGAPDSPVPDSKAGAISTLRALGAKGHTRAGSVSSELSEDEALETEHWSISRRLARKAGGVADEAETASSPLSSDAEGGMTRRTAYKSRKAKVKIPPAARSKDKADRGATGAGAGAGAEWQASRSSSQSGSDKAKSELCEPGTLVWAKMQGYPFFPGVVFDQEDREGIPPSVLSDRSKQEELLSGGSGSGSLGGGGGGGEGTWPGPSESELVLVKFFDKSGSWMWARSGKLRMMFEDSKLDEGMLMIKDKRHVKMRKQVREAYEAAKAQME